MKGGIILAASIACIVIIIIIRLLGSKKEQRSQCQMCGKFYGGIPARCPHCGEPLKWKRP